MATGTAPVCCNTLSRTAYLVPPFHYSTSPSGSCLLFLFCFRCGGGSCLFFLFVFCGNHPNQVKNSLRTCPAPPWLAGCAALFVARPARSPLWGFQPSSHLTWPREWQRRCQGTEGSCARSTGGWLSTTGRCRGGRAARPGYNSRAQQRRRTASRSRAPAGGPSRGGGR